LGTDAGEAPRRIRAGTHLSRDMSHIFVPSIKSGFGARLPTNMDSPGYWIASNKEGLEQLARYVNKQEWQELANGANMAHIKYAATSNGLVMGLLFGTCGICFCPLLCYGCFVDVEGKANADIEKLPVTQKLKERGIGLHFIPKTSKFDMGGMECAISAQTPAPPPVQDGGSTMQAVVPPGTAAGATFLVQMADGQQMQVTVPPGSKEGDTIAFATPPPARQNMSR